MAITNDTVQYGTNTRAIDTSSPTSSGLDILGVVVAAAMLLLPLTAGGTHYSHVGWEQTESGSAR